jgi:hypothetical protein
MMITHHFTCPKSDILNRERNVLADTGTRGRNVAVGVVRTLAAELVLVNGKLLAVC